MPLYRVTDPDGKRIALVRLLWTEWLSLRPDSAGLHLVGDLPPYQRQCLYARGLAPTNRIALIPTLRPHEEPTRA